jgi:hypothetical protein
VVEFRVVAEFRVVMEFGVVVTAALTTRPPDWFPTEHLFV